MINIIALYNIGTLLKLADYFNEGIQKYFGQAEKNDVKY
jgi:hypothetical protein